MAATGLGMWMRGRHHNSTPVAASAIGHRAPQARNRRLKRGRCREPASARRPGTLSWSGSPVQRADSMATARRGERHVSCSRPRRSCSRPGRRPAAHRPKWGCRLIQPGCPTAPVQFEPLSTRPWGVVAHGSHGAGDVDARTTPQSTPPWPPSVTAPHRRVTGGSNSAGVTSRPVRGAMAP